jgi:hypothetical protein
MSRSSTTLIMAVAAIAALGVAAPAAAHPEFRLAPACSTIFQFPTGFQINQDNGIAISLRNPVQPTLQDAPATYHDPASGQPVSGTANGTVDGANVDFTIKWASGDSSHYTGVINNNLTAQGMATNSKNVQNVWASAPTTFSCKHVTDPGVPIVAPDDSSTSQKPTPVPTPVAASTAQVVSDVDVYKSVDPKTGGVDKLGILRQGSTVTLIGKCAKDDWCNVKGSTVPSGQGWAWGALKF